MLLDARQAFDPRTTTVATAFSLSGNRNDVMLWMEAQTFLTDDHLLMDRFRFLNAPHAPVRIAFTLVMPFDAGSCNMDYPVHARSIRLAPLKIADGLRCSYKLCGYRVYGGRTKLARFVLRSDQWRELIRQ